MRQRAVAIDVQAVHHTPVGHRRDVLEGVAGDVFAGRTRPDHRVDRDGRSGGGVRDGDGFWVGQRAPATADSHVGATVKLFLRPAAYAAATVRRHTPAVACNIV